MELFLDVMLRSFLFAIIVTPILCKLDNCWDEYLSGTFVMFFLGVMEFTFIELAKGIFNFIEHWR